VTRDNAAGVLAYWFGDAADDPQAASGRGSLWFGAGPRIDDEIRHRFGKLAGAAADGTLDDWREQPETCLALIVLLDQFPRNIHRGTPGAFAQDARAFGIAAHAVGRGFPLRLTPPQQGFLLMPYEHSESRAVQRRSVALFEALARSAPPEWRQLTGGFARYAREHAAIVERFGRFPHRNAILGRRSTAAEIDYLRRGASTFGQGG